MTVNQLSVRACSADDLVVLRSQWPTSADVHGAHHSQQRAGAATYLVAWRGEVPLGSCMVQWGGCVGDAARVAFPAAVEINHLQVREQFRGQGVGRSLIESAEALAAQAGRNQVAVGVGDDNPDAERLYVRLGYLPTGVFDVTEYDWVDEDDVVHHAIERDQVLIKEIRGSARDAL